MRAFLVVALVTLSAVVSRAQAPTTSSDAQQDAIRRANIERVNQMIEWHNENIQAALADLPVTIKADTIRLESDGDYHAYGHIRIAVDGVVITADNAVIHNGEVQLGANGRIMPVPK
jgi:lipopolysaccharide assembly outer membrane protein LptD (OstA)